MRPPFVIRAKWHGGVTSNMHRPTVRPSGAGSRSITGRPDTGAGWSARTSSTGSPVRGVRGAARLAREPASSCERRLEALSRCGHRRGLRRKRLRRLRRHADDDRHPGRRLPHALAALAEPSTQGHSPTHPGNRPPAQLPHPGWGGRPFHPPPAASVTPKMTPRSAKIRENVRQHRGIRYIASTVVELWPAQTARNLN